MVCGNQEVEMKEDDKKGFTVTDRRIKLDEEMPTAQTQEASAEKKSASAPVQDKIPLPEMTFASFIISLNTSALIHLGLLPDPISGKAEPNLELAKQMIDLLGILQDKTRGNLTQEEQDLFENLLFDLRIKYVEMSKDKKEK